MYPHFSNNFRHLLEKKLVKNNQKMVLVLHKSYKFANATMAKYLPTYTRK